MNRQEQTGTDRNRQEQTGTDRNRQEQTGTDRNRQEQTGTAGIDRIIQDRNRQEQAGIDRIIYLIEKIIASLRNSYVRQEMQK